MLNKSNVSFIHFENLKEVYNKTKQSLELYEGLKKLKNKSDAIIDVYGDPFNGVLDDILKNNEELLVYLAKFCPSNDWKKDFKFIIY